MFGTHFLRRHKLQESWGLLRRLMEAGWGLGSSAGGGSIVAVADMQVHVFQLCDRMNICDMLGQTTPLHTGRLD